MGDSEGKSGFSGSIAALAGLITAIATLVTILFQAGIIGGDKKVAKSEPTAVYQETEPTEKVVPNTTQNHNIVLQQRLDSLNQEAARKREAELKKQIVAMEEQLRQKQQEEARKPAAQNKPVVATIGGKWMDQYSGGLYEINQFDDKITFVEYSMFLGIRTVSAEGNGTISNNSVVVEYNTIFDTSGKLTLQIQEQGKALSGTFHDYNTGGTANIYLVRQ